MKLGSYTAKRVHVLALADAVVPVGATWPASDRARAVHAAPAVGRDEAAPGSSSGLNRRTSPHAVILTAHFLAGYLVRSGEDL